MATEKALTITDKEMLDLQRWSNLAMTGGITPQGQTAAQTMAILAVGREFGLQNFQALRNFVFVKGRLTASSDFLLAQLKARGVKIKLIESNAKICTMEFKQGDDDPIRITWTMEDAKTAGLADKDNWRHYPAQMLRARCKSDGAKFYPDITLGVYSTEEMRDLQTTEIPEAAPDIEKEGKLKDIEVFIDTKIGAKEPAAISAPNNNDNLPDGLQGQPGEKVAPKLTHEEIERRRFAEKDADKDYGIIPNKGDAPKKAPAAPAAKPEKPPEPAKPSKPEPKKPDAKKPDPIKTEAKPIEEEDMPAPVVEKDTEPLPETKEKGIADEVIGVKRAKDEPNATSGWIKIIKAKGPKVGLKENLVEGTLTRYYNVKTYEELSRDQAEQLIHWINDTADGALEAKLVVGDKALAFYQPPKEGVDRI